MPQGAKANTLVVGCEGAKPLSLASRQFGLVGFWAGGRARARRNWAIGPGLARTAGGSHARAQARLCFRPSSSNHVPK